MDVLPISHGLQLCDLDQAVHEWCARPPRTPQRHVVSVSPASSLLSSGCVKLTLHTFDGCCLKRGGRDPRRKRQPKGANTLSLPLPLPLSLSPCESACLSLSFTQTVFHLAPLLFLSFELHATWLLTNKIAIPVVRQRLRKGMPR